MAVPPQLFVCRVADIIGKPGGLSWIKERLN